MEKLKSKAVKPKPPIKFKQKSEKTNSGRKLTFKLTVRLPRSKRVKKRFKKFVKSLIPGER